MVEKWVLTTDNDGYYTGKKYVYQGAVYAVVDKDKNLAKSYSSYPKAVAANKKLSFENYTFEVERLSE